MPRFTARFQDKIIEPLDDLAAAHGLSRNAFLEHLAHQAVKRGFIPIRPGEGLRVDTPSGGLLSLIQDSEFVVAGQRGLSESEQAIYRQARRLAERGRWYQAKSLLIEAGFQVACIAAE